MYTPEDCLRCVVSLLKDEAYDWWETQSSMASGERVTSDYFQIEFKKKYVSLLYLDKKKKIFLELKQGK